MNIQLKIPDDTKEVMILTYNNPVNGTASDYQILRGKMLNDSIMPPDELCNDCEYKGKAQKDLTCGNCRVIAQSNFKRAKRL